jgi:hypothetical protein
MHVRLEDLRLIFNCNVIEKKEANIGINLLRSTDPVEIFEIMSVCVKGSVAPSGMPSPMKWK